MIQIDIPNIIIKPYVRMTRRGKYVSKQAQEYLASKDRLSIAIWQQMQYMDQQIMPGQKPLKVIIRLYAPTAPGHRCDLDNQIKAILDACNNVAFPDDRWVDQIDAQRYIGKESRLMLIILRV